MSNLDLRLPIKEELAGKSEQIRRDTPMFTCMNFHGGEGLAFRNSTIVVLCTALLAVTGCQKRAATPRSSEPLATVSPAKQEPGEAKLDVCGLIKNEEIESVQGSPIKETKSSGRSDGGFRVSQCFYTAAVFSKSVSLSVTQSDPDSPSKRSPRDFWRDTFGRYSGEEEEREGDKEKRESLREQERGKREEGKSIPPRKIDGVGEEAYWTANRVGGALYLLKKDAFIRISLGGPDNEETKISKSKSLAEKALPRL